jgi:hypothetical protein
MFDPFTEARPEWVLASVRPDPERHPRRRILHRGEQRRRRGRLLRTHRDAVTVMPRASMCAR